MRHLLAAFALTGPVAGAATAAQASDFSMPWRKPDRAIVIDAYEYNPIDWHKLTTDKRIAGFINKASDGLPPKYSCSGNETEVKLCKALWKRYAVAKELYATRRIMAKALGLSWGAYHLGRPGNPIDQANHFIDFTDPQPDELIAIDIEDNRAEWMSLADAEIFARHVYKRLGRYPVLYTNGSTAQHIADNRAKYPLLSRLNLWYARYKPSIGEHFPKGNWTSYALWQFSTQVNCSRRSCFYRPPGTPDDIDVNVAAMTPDELRQAWPLSGLVEEIPLPDTAIVVAGSALTGETAPVPAMKAEALAGTAALAYAPVEAAPMPAKLALSYLLMGSKPESEAAKPVADAAAPVQTALAEGPLAPDRAMPSGALAPHVATASLTGETAPLPIPRMEAAAKANVEYAPVELASVKDRLTISYGLMAQGRAKDAPVSVALAAGPLPPDRAMPSGALAPETVELAAGPLQPDRAMPTGPLTVATAVAEAETTADAPVLAMTEPVPLPSPRPVLRKAAERRMAASLREQKRLTAGLDRQRDRTVALLLTRTRKVPLPTPRPEDANRVAIVRASASANDLMQAVMLAPETRDPPRDSSAQIAAYIAAGKALAAGEATRLAAKEAQDVASEAVIARSAAHPLRQHGQYAMAHAGYRQTVSYSGEDGAGIDMIVTGSIKQAFDAKGNPAYAARLAASRRAPRVCIAPLRVTSIGLDRVRKPLALSAQTLAFLEASEL